MRRTIPSVAVAVVLAVSLVWAATESQFPDCVTATVTNLSGTCATAIGGGEDPDSPDADWYTAGTNTANTDIRVSFPTPTGPPTGSQTFKVWARRDSVGGGSGSPTIACSAYEGGTLRCSTTLSGTVTSDTGELFSGTFDWSCASWSNSDGSGVEMQCTGTKGGGGPNQRTVEFGAFEWTVNYSTGGRSRRVF